MKKYTKYSVIALSLCLVTFGIYHHYTPISVTSRAQILHTFYGDMAITEPVLCDLLVHPALERLKKIHQYGTCHYVRDLKLNEYTRWDHSIGVFALLRKNGAPLTEQIAGLLHDVSHTVFSHAGDYLFNQSSDHNPYILHNSYQDNIHAWYLRESGLDTTLAQHGYTIEDILHKKGEFTALECELPDICADRLEYNLQGGVHYGIIDPSDVEIIVNHICFEHDRWFFTDAVCAKKVALVSLYLSDHLWGSAENNVVNTYTSQALHRMLENREITMHDIHFGTDDIMWEKMKTSSDEYVRNLTKKIVEPFAAYSEGDTAHFDKKFVSKFRGIDPLIKVDDRLVRLTELDNDYCTRYQATHAIMQRGWYITYNDTQESRA